MSIPDFTSSSGSLHAGAIVAIVVFLLFLIAGVVFLVMYLKKEQERKIQPNISPYDVQGEKMHEVAF